MSPGKQKFELIDFKGVTAAGVNGLNEKICGEWIGQEIWVGCAQRTREILRDALRAIRKKYPIRTYY